MADPSLHDHPITIPIVGNDFQSKEFVMQLCLNLGFEVLDFGPVRFAHIIEGLYLLRRNARLNDDYFEWNYPTRTNN